MAIAFDSSTTPWARQNSWTSWTVAHTTSWTDRFLVVNVGTQWNVVTGVTYWGVSMTLTGSYSWDGAGNWTTTWTLANPSSWANNIVVTTSVSCVKMLHAVSYTWVAQTSPIDANVTNWPTPTTSWTQTLTTTVNNDWLIMCAKGRNGSAITAWANTFVRCNIELLFTWLFVADSNSAQTPTGSKSMNITSASQEFNGTMFALKPAVSANTWSWFFAFM